MSKVKFLWWGTALAILIVMACGPNTIFLRQGLDTPAHHVANGQALINRKKFIDACREFERARELDPYYTDAYIGLGLSYAGSGDYPKGLGMMRLAEAMADNDQERENVQQGYERLNRFKP